MNINDLTKIYERKNKLSELFSIIEKNKNSTICNLSGSLKAIYLSIYIKKKPNTNFFYFSKKRKCTNFFK